MLTRVSIACQEQIDLASLPSSSERWACWRPLHPILSHLDFSFSFPLKLDMQEKIGSTHEHFHLFLEKFSND